MVGLQWSGPPALSVSVVFKQELSAAFSCTAATLHHSDAQTIFRGSEEITYSNQTYTLICKLYRCSVAILTNDKGCYSVTFVHMHSIISVFFSKPLRVSCNTAEHCQRASGPANAWGVIRPQKPGVSDWQTVVLTHSHSIHCCTNQTVAMGCVLGRQNLYHLCNKLVLPATLATYSLPIMTSTKTKYWICWRNTNIISGYSNTPPSSSCWHWLFLWLIPPVVPHKVSQSVLALTTSLQELWIL